MTAESNSSILTHILSGLQRLGAEELSRMVVHLLDHPSEAVRKAGLEVFEIADDDDLKRVVALLRDPSDSIFHSVQSKIMEASHQNSHVLVASLNLPSHRIRKGILQILDSLRMTDLDLRSYIHVQLIRGYTNLAFVNTLKALPQTRERDMLITHLGQERRLEMQNLLKIMSEKDGTGKMRIIWRGITSRDKRRRSNSLEALDQFLDPSLSNMISPLLDDIPHSKALRLGREHFQLPELDSRSLLFTYLLQDPDWVRVILALTLIYRGDPSEADPAVIQQLRETGDEPIRQTAESLMTSGFSPFLDRLVYLHRRDGHDRFRYV